MGKIRKWKASATSKGSASNQGVRRSTWDQRIKLRAERAATLAAQAALDDEIRSAKRAERERREDKERRKEENRAKGLQYQKISTAKVKKLSRNQLKHVFKADTTGVTPKFMPGTGKPDKGALGKRRR